LNSNDKEIWDTAYNEEFDGLSLLPTWEIISEDKFHQLYKNVKILPSMAIAIIKYDAHNKPKRAKYRIVVLGNHDYHQWSKESTAAPVMSQLEPSPAYQNTKIILSDHRLDVHVLLQGLIGNFFKAYMVYTMHQNYGTTKSVPIFM
jgi:hypothetical protein